MDVLIVEDDDAMAGALAAATLSGSPAAQTRCSRTGTSR